MVLWGVPVFLYGVPAFLWGVPVLLCGVPLFQCGDPTLLCGVPVWCSCLQRRKDLGFIVFDVAALVIVSPSFGHMAVAAISLLALVFIF